MKKTIIALALAALLAAPIQARPVADQRDEFQEYIEAQEDAARSRTLFRMAENDFGAAVRNAKQDFEQSKEYREAKAEEDRTYASYLEARKAALADLQDNSRYNALLTLRNDLGRKLEDARQDKRRDPETLVPMATLKLRYSADIRVMEEELLRDNKDVADKLEKSKAATLRTVEMRRAFDESVRQNEKIADARRSLEDAKLEVIASQARLSAAKDSVRAAEQFRYYQHRYDHLKYGRRDRWIFP
jgi:hypothetical protein